MSPHSPEFWTQPGQSQRAPSETTREFRSAAQSTLEALVFEHERALVASQAELRSEVARLRVELRTLHAMSPGNGDEPSAVPPEPPPPAPRRWSDAQLSDVWSHEGSGHFDVAFPSADSWPHQGDKDQLAPQSCEVGSLDLWPSESVVGPEVTWNETARTVLRRAVTTENPNAFSDFRIPIGSCQTFRTWILEGIMSFVIVMNVVSLGISSALDGNGGWFGWALLDGVFAGIFTLEIVLKLYWQSCRIYFAGSSWRWNYFEALLVVLAWLEVSWKIAEGPTIAKSSLMRTLKLVRLAKLLRVLRLPVFCELLMMVNGAIGSYKTLLYSMLLIWFPIYAAALVLHELLGNLPPGHGAELFGRLDLSFFTLFRCFVGADCTQEDGKPLFMLLTYHYSWVYGLIYCLVQFLMTFGLFNVISAIYVENTVSAAKFNDLVIKRQRLQDRENFAEKAQRLLNLIWRRYLELTPSELATFKLVGEGWLRTKPTLDQEVAGHFHLTREFFEDLCSQKSFSDALRDLDVSDDDQYDLFKTLDTEGRRSINLLDFIAGIDKLRGDARKADLVYVALRLRSLLHRLDNLDTKLSRGSQHAQSASLQHAQSVTFAPSVTLARSGTDCI